MKRSIPAIHFFALYMILLAGCTPKKTSMITRSMTPDEIMKIIEQHNREIISLQGFGQISIDTPELSNNGSISVKLLRPDSLLVDITGPFGVGVARGLVTSMNFQFYNGIENKLFYGATNARNMKNILRMSVEFPQIINLFAGTMNFSNHPEGVTPTGVWRGNEYLISYTGAEETTEYVIDADYESITRYLKKNSQGDILEEIKFKSFKSKSDLYIPQVISINRPPLEQTLTLFYESQTINEFPIDFTLKIPSGAMKVQL